jgi:hypothetical protein
VSRWAKAQVGIGPVLAAGLAAYIDITRTPTVSALWSLAGLNPTAVWGKGEKRPWNAQLKTLCCLPGTMITTRRGYIPLEEVTTEDEVLTHTGRYRRVTATLSRDYSGPVVGLRARGNGNEALWITPEHPIYAQTLPKLWYHDQERGRRYKKIGTAPFAWYQAQALERGDVVALPTVPQDHTALALTVDTEGTIAAEDGGLLARGRWAGVAAPRAVAVPARVSVTPALARLAGLYATEGHVSGNHLGFSFHERETDLQAFVCHTMHDIFGLQPSFQHNVLNHCVQLMFHSRPLARTFAGLFGRGSADAHLPQAWLSSSPDIAHALLQGLLDGDGDHAPPQQRFTTVSPQLAYQARDLWRRLGYGAAVHRESQGQAYRVNRLAMVGGTLGAVILDEYSGPVYNLEVEDDESYVAQGIAVHNCWKIGDSFCKFHNHPGCVYGQYYAARKQLEVERNAAGRFRDQAEKTLANRALKDKATRAIYEAGQLPAGRLELRARRVAVKLFLSHYWEVAYCEHYRERPRTAYILMKEPEVHRHYLAPPGYETVWPEPKGV